MSEPTMGELLKAKNSKDMTLRDWFAGQALTNRYTHDGGGAMQIASWAYQIADAMLAARNNENENK